MSERYKYYIVPGSKVVCISTYAGKRVRGVAICADSDEFDVEKGKMLARARVDFKIAEKRQTRAFNKLAEAQEEYEKADQHLFNMEEYADDANQAYWDAETVLNEILEMF